MMTLSLALILAMQAQDEKEAEKAATEALAQFQKAFKGTDQERTDAVDELAKVQHPKVVSKLGSLLGGAVSSPVRIAVAKALGGFTEQKKPAATALANAIPANAKEPNVYTKLFEAIGNLHEPSSVSLLTRYYDDKDQLIAQNAVFTTGKVGCGAGVEPLINFLARHERIAKPSSGTGVAVQSNNPNQQGGGLLIGGSSNNAAKERAQAMVTAANQALTEISKEQLNTAEAWSAWWAKNKATFDANKK
jgi:hypothetical protein